MQLVTFKDGICQGKTITGQYPFVSEKEGPAGNLREMTVRISRNGKEVNVQANRADYQITELHDKAPAKPKRTALVTPEMIELDRRIRVRFNIMEKLTEFAIQGNVRAMIISGAAGIGKSYNLEKRLNQAIDNAEINQFTILKGKISAIALFAQLFKHKEKGDILVLDDIDVVFQDETSLNLLKAALDTGERRHLVWLTASAWLEEQGVDQEFDFEGACVFITNLNFDAMIEKGSQLAPHFAALINRTIYLDLGIHTNLEILVRVKQVVNTTPMLDVHGIDNEQKEVMLDWLDDHYENLRDLSLRTILKLSSFMKGDPTGWKDIAEATMIKYSQGYTVQGAVGIVSGAATGQAVLAAATGAAEEQTK